MTVTWQDAENALEAAFEYLRALPDRERAFLSAGSRSCWPEIVRNRADMDYAQGEGMDDRVAAPSARLTRVQMALLEAVLLGPAAAVLAIPEDSRALVYLVIGLKRWPPESGFGWDLVWRAERERERRAGRRLQVTSDALRKRYERGVGKVATRMERLGIGFEEWV
jgi:hypothetical protein